MTVTLDMTLTQNVTLTQNSTLTQNLTWTKNSTLTQNLTLTLDSTLNQIEFADKGFIIKTLYLWAFLVSFLIKVHVYEAYITTLHISVLIIRFFKVLFTFPLRSSLLFENASVHNAILLKCVCDIWHLP